MQISPLTANAASKKRVGGTLSALALVSWESYALKKKGEWQPFLAKRVKTFCVEPSSTELSTLIKDWHITSWQVMLEEEYGTKIIGIMALPGLAQNTQLWQEQLSQQTGYSFLYFFILHIIDGQPSLIPTKAQGLAFELINRNCQVIFFFFHFFFLKVSIYVNFCVEENMKGEIISLQDVTKGGTLFMTFKWQILKLLWVQAG